MDKDLWHVGVSLLIWAALIIGVIIGEGILYLCGKKNTLFNESWRMILK